jgi:hypothetical protein
MLPILNNQPIQGYADDKPLELQSETLRQYIDDLNTPFKLPQNYNFRRILRILNYQVDYLSGEIAGYFHLLI